VNGSRSVTIRTELYCLTGKFASFGIVFYISGLLDIEQSGEQDENQFFEIQGEKLVKKSMFSTWIYTGVPILIALLLVAAGCSGSTPVLSDMNFPIDGGDEEVVITFGAYEYQRNYYETLMKSFHEENPNITVQFVDLASYFSNDVVPSIQKYLRDSAQAADTILFSGSFNFDMSRYFRNLRPLYEADPNFQPDDFWPGILSACEDGDGNVWGMPITTTVNGIFYDQVAFEEAGLPYPEPGWTWEDFKVTVDALADKQGDQIKYGFYDEPELWGSILAPIVSEHLKSHGGEVDSAELLEEINWYRELVQAEAIAGLKVQESLEHEWEVRNELFKSDAFRPAMWVGSINSAIPNEGNVFDTNDPYYGMAIGTYGLAPYPVLANDSSPQSNPTWVECAVISAGSKNPRAAWAWLSFLSREWVSSDKMQIFEMVRAPARRSVADSNGYWDLIPEKAISAVRFALEHGYYDLNSYEQFYDIGLALAQTIHEGAEFEQALKAALAVRAATPTPEQDDSPIVVATAVPLLPEGVVSIEYYLNQYNWNEISRLNELADQFNQSSPEAKIRIVTEFYGNSGEDYINSMASEFDCFISNAPYWDGFNDSGLLSLNSLFNSETASFTGDFSEEMMEKFTKEGNLYALPASSQVQMLAYNADLLARRGLPMPDKDWTFDDFIEMALAAASTSDADPSYGFMYNLYDEFLMRGKGVKWANLESSPPQVYLDSREMLNFVGWLMKMEEDNVLYNQDHDWDQTQAILNSGQLAFWQSMMGEKFMWFEGAGGEPPYKIGMVPYPKSSGDESIVTWSNDRGHFISAQSEAPKVCWEWIKLMSDQPTLFSGIPARTSLAESQAWEASVGKEDAEAYRAAAKKLSPPENLNLDHVEILWPLINFRGQALKAVIEGQEIQSTLIKYQQKADIYLACALALDTSGSFEQVNEAIIECINQVDEGGNS